MQSVCTSSNEILSHFYLFITVAIRFRIPIIRNYFVELEHKPQTKLITILPIQNVNPSKQYCMHKNNSIFLPTPLIGLSLSSYTHSNILHLFIRQLHSYTTQQYLYRSEIIPAKSPH